MSLSSSILPARESQSHGSRDQSRPSQHIQASSNPALPLAECDRPFSPSSFERGSLPKPTKARHRVARVGDARIKIEGIFLQDAAGKKRSCVRNAGSTADTESGGTVYTANQVQPLSPRRFLGNGCGKTVKFGLSRRVSRALRGSRDAHALAVHVGVARNVLGSGCGRKPALVSERSGTRLSGAHGGRAGHSRCAARPSDTRGRSRS